MADNGFWYFWVVFILVDLIIVYFVVWKRWQNRNLFGPEREYIRRQWKIIDVLFEKDPRSAIVEADKLLDYSLKARVHVNASVGQNLKTYAGLFSDLDGIWRAHKLRNQLVHELNFQISSQDRTMARQNFYRALKDLGM